ncbi:MAG: hypothetical protein [Bacteriophage sp.]|nr:MAG: hypothetical protein [Bacteriophage sp.]UWD54158.1 MAG: hypothetical protein [Bacteriophage sp.]UWD68025.1 MAG: hypothetical protein [Bacteriophage sp.]UWG79599.1 MAG: hypothetical protein [Bacteriophage sp.]
MPDEYKKAIEEFGAQYALFLNKYPTLQKRISSVPTVYDSVKNGGLSFVEIDKYFKDGASEWWIRTMVIDLFMVLGAFDVTTPYQFKAIAQRIRQEYYHVTPSELTRFFYEFSMGEYGEIYVGKTVNPQRLFIALDKYMCKVYEKRAEIDSQRNLDKQKIEDEKARMNAISYEEYCRRVGIDPKESPLEKLKRKLEKESKRDKNGRRK